MKKITLMLMLSIFLVSCSKGDREKASFTISGEFRMDGTCELTLNGVSANYVRKKPSLDAVLLQEKLWFGDSCGYRNNPLLLIGATIPELNSLFKAYKKVPSGGINLVNDPQSLDLKFAIAKRRLKEYSIETYGGDIDVDRFDLHVQKRNIPFSINSIFICNSTAKIEIGELIYFSETNRERSGIEYAISGKAVLERGSCI